MYGKTNGLSLNKLRAEKSDKGIYVKKTEDNLHQHLLRVMYQLYIWITANYVAWQELPRAQDFGYKMVEDKYLSKLHRWSVMDEQHHNYLMTSYVFVK